MGGNIGTAILSLEPPADNRTHVIECSSFQIDLTPSLAPTIGALLNISPDHLDRHGTMERYSAIKERLVERAANVVIGVDDALFSRRSCRDSRGTFCVSGYRIDNPAASTRMRIASTFVAMVFRCRSQISLALDLCVEITMRRIPLLPSP